MRYLIYIFFGLAPSIIWLLFYLRKDAHPESNKMIIKIFLFGMIITFAAGLIEIGGEAIFSLLKFINIPLFLILALYHFIGIALVEEFFKYLIVKGSVLNNLEFDEPVDAMLYMIIAALGFAALENMLYLFPKEEIFLLSKVFQRTITISSIRFIGATFLHALCSGTVGYFLALSCFEPKKRFRLIALGLGIAAVLHGLFNISIIEVERNLIVQNGKVSIINFPSFILSAILVIVILGGLAIFVSFGFRKLKRLKSICKIK